MARNFSTAFQNALNSDIIRYFYLIQIDLGSTIRVTSHSSNISWDGQTWTADGGLFEIDAPKFSTVIDREAYKVVLTDLNEEFFSYFETGAIGKKIYVWAGLLDSNNEPLTGADDIVSLYSGFIDSPQFTVNSEEKLAVIEGSSPMADLDQVRVIMVSKDGMDQFSASDTSYDGIFEDSETLVKWGKV